MRLFRFFFFLFSAFFHLSARFLLFCLLSLLYRERNCDKGNSLLRREKKFFVRERQHEATNTTTFPFLSLFPRSSSFSFLRIFLFSPSFPFSRELRCRKRSTSESTKQPPPRPFLSFPFSLELENERRKKTHFPFSLSLSLLPTKKQTPPLRPRRCPLARPARHPVALRRGVAHAHGHGRHPRDRRAARVCAAIPAVSDLRKSEDDLLCLFFLIVTLRCWRLLFLVRVQEACEKGVGTEECGRRVCGREKRR